MITSNQFQRPGNIFKFFDVGFHGDKYLLLLINKIISGCHYFIETGANVGSTLAYVARKYPHVKCFSCEPAKDAFCKARENTREYSNVSIFNKTSPEFFTVIKNQQHHFFEKKVLFWLDAHCWGFKWPLKDEIRFITSNFENVYILIDDFRVPGLEEFGYFKNSDDICSLEYIKESIKIPNFDLYYPSYTEKTSQHHPLIGWGMIVFGQNKFEIPHGLKGMIRKEEKALLF